MGEVAGRGVVRKDSRRTCAPKERMSHQSRRQEEQGPCSICRQGTQRKGVGSLKETDVNRAVVGLGEETEGVSMYAVQKEAKSSAKPGDGEGVAS